jgi:hypothetical protein
MMWESFFELDDAWNQGVQEERPKADVIEFPQK